MNINTAHIMEENHSDKLFGNFFFKRIFYNFRFVEHEYAGEFEFEAEGPNDFLFYPR